MEPTDLVTPSVDTFLSVPTKGVALRPDCGAVVVVSAMPALRLVLKFNTAFPLSIELLTTLVFRPQDAM